MPFVFAILVALFGAVHYYVWARLVRDSALPPPWGPLLTWLIVLLGLSVPATLALRRHVTHAYERWLSWPAYLWMGFLFILFLLVAFGDLVRLLVALVPAELNAERRLFFRRGLGAALTAAGATIGAVAVRRARQRPKVKELTIELRRLPPELDGTTIVQLTDIHVGGTIDGDFLRDVVNTTNALRPDLVAITGDLVDGSVAQLGSTVALLGALRSRYGTYFVTGNHEYYAGVDAWLAELSRLGIRVLRNERVSIGNGAASFDLAGIDDYNAHGEGHGPDLGRAVDGRDQTRELVLLAHQPRAINDAARLGVGLQLSGHTHGGQIWPWSYAVLLQQPFVVGHVRVGETQLYVSPGTGYWGPPMRLGTTSEITRLTFRAV